MAVVEAEDEMGLARPQALQRVAVAFGEIPDIARPKVLLFGLAVGGDDGGADVAGDHVGPFRGDRMPMQFANAARL